MKKLIATLSAVTMLLCAVPMQASAISVPSLELSPSGLRAEDIYKRTISYTAGSNCGLARKEAFYERAFAVITDGTAPSEESLQAIPDFESCEEFVVEDGLIHRTDDSFSGWYNDFDSGLPEGKVFYKITVSGYDNLIRSARQYLLENDNVQDVFFMQYVENGGWGTWLDHGLKLFIYFDSMDSVPEDGIEGLVLGECRENEYGEFFCIAELDDANKARLDGTDDDLKVLVEVANKALTEYDDVVEDIWLSSLFPLTEEIGKTKTSAVWLDLGDADGNTAVNASDAAIVLQMAAEVGAGNADVQNLDVLDVNLDGTVNAADAACILIYAAQVGASGSADWQDILK